MTIYVLDASALIRYIDREAGGERVKAILVANVAGQAAVCISAVQWGEVAGNLRKRLGAAEEMRILDSLLPDESEVVAVTAERAMRAAALKVDQKLSYADAFAVDLAMDSADCVLVTADYNFKKAEGLARMEFLPAK